MREKSHIYELSRMRMLVLTAGPTLAASVLALGLRLAGEWTILPRPWPLENTDCTIVAHQGHAADSGPAAEVILAGDSSCLMDVDAHLLAKVLDADGVLNLGTLSYLHVEGARLLLERYCRRHSPPRTVVLLWHPQTLRQAGAERYFVGILYSYWKGEEICPPGRRGRRACLLGLVGMRERVLSRITAFAMSGEYFWRYGFTRDLWREMERRGGGMSACGRYDSVRDRSLLRPEFRLDGGFTGRAAGLREVLPAGTRLLVGLTPLPHSLVPAGYAAERDRLLQGCGEAFAADGLLAGLPAVMPDDLFAGPRHLNERGGRTFTRLLAREIAVR